MTVLFFIKNICGKNYYKTKKPRPIVETTVISTFIKRWFRSCDLHSLLNESFRLQFPFVFRRIQSLQMLHPVHPCLLLSLLTFSGPSIPRLIVVSFSLSDLRCFGILSSASVLDSDYSASVLLFLFFPVPPHSCFPGARLGSRLLGFLFLSGLVSRAFLPDSCTRLYCWFPFTLP